MRNITPIPVHVVPVVGRPRGQLGHHLDGRYGALRPDGLVRMIDRLLDLVDLSAVDVVMGVPEGGYLPAFCFAERADRPVVLASRMHHDLPGLIAFEEAHTRDVGTTHHVYGLFPGQRVLVVEDEVTTGTTLLGAVDALRGGGMIVDQAAALLCIDDPAIAPRFQAAGIRLHIAGWIPRSVRDDLMAREADSGSE